MSIWKRTGVHKKPIYVGKISSDHGYRGHKARSIALDCGEAVQRIFRSRQNMYLFLHTRALWCEVII